MLLLLFLAPDLFFLLVLLLLLFAFGSIRTISGSLSVWVLITGSLKVVREGVTDARTVGVGQSPLFRDEALPAQHMETVSEGHRLSYTS